MIVIDEAGQMELRWFPEEVSTIAGLGAMFVTGWQSKSQITARYGPLADAVLSGHRSKVIFNGTGDPSTLDYVSRIGGTVHMPQRGWSTDNVGGRRTVSESPQREDLLRPHVVRQMRRLDAVLLYGTLPPVHLRLVRWWKDKHLRALVPHGPDGKPVALPTDGTCPVDSTRRSEVAPVIDAAVLAEQVAQLPKPKHRQPDVANPPPELKPRPRAVAPEQPTLDFDAPTAHVLDSQPDANRVAGRCERCGTHIEVGAGRELSYGQRRIVICQGSCGSQRNRESSPWPVHAGRRRGRSQAGPWVTPQGRWRRRWPSRDGHRRVHVIPA